MGLMSVCAANGSYSLRISKTTMMPLCMRPRSSTEAPAATTCSGRLAAPPPLEPEPFAGDILALTSITLTTGANTSGRALARNGAVTLDSNNVNTCGALVCPIITVNPSTLPNGTVGTLYSQTITASGGTAPYAFSVSGGALPGGLTLNTITGEITGTPTTAGTFNFSITATDATSCPRQPASTPCPLPALAVRPSR